MSNQSFTYDVAQNLTANAFVRKYTVTYNYNDATGGNSAASATATATFNGWATSASGAKVYDDKQSVKNLATSGTYNLYANWTLGTVTLPTPTKTGYTFGGWYTDSALTTSAGAAGAKYTPSAAVTLYAKWTAGSYTVKFNGNGATSGSMSNQSFTYDVAQNLTAIAFQRKYIVTYNYNGATGGNSAASATATATFNGWATSASGAKVYNDKQSVKNLATGGTYNLYANWTLGTVTLTTPTKTGYTFSGWNTKSDASGTNYNGGASFKPTAATTLYAQWTVNTYAVTVSAGTGTTISGVTAGTYEYGTVFNISVSAKTGYDQSTPTLKVNGTVVTPNADGTYTVTIKGETAITTDALEKTAYTVTLDPDGGVCGIPAITAYYNEIYGTLPEPTRDGFAFDGWFLADGTLVTESTICTMTADHTLTAHWTAVETSGTLTAKADSGAVVDRERGFVYGLAFGVTEAALREQYLEIADGTHIEIERVTAAIGTGTVLHLVDDTTGDELESFTVVIFGDVTGDGLLNSSDVTEIRSVNAGIITYEADSAQFSAADVTRDGNVNSSDVTEFRNANAGISEVSQTI